MVVPHNVVRIQGAMPGGEVWSVNPRFIPNFGGPITAYADLLAWANAIPALLAALPTATGIRQNLSSSATITVVRTEYIDVAGRLDQAAEVVLTTPVAGGGAATKPFQTAIVTTLETGRPGRSYKGRLYWPALGAAIDAGTLRVATANTAALAGQVAQLLADIATAAPGDEEVVPAVVSQTSNVATAVQQVSVGNVLDTQRRRRDALEEARSVAVIP